MEHLSEALVAGVAFMNAAAWWRAVVLAAAAVALLLLASGEFNVLHQAY